MFDALNSRKPNFFSRWSMWIVCVTDWNPWSEMNRRRSSGRVRETRQRGMVQLVGLGVDDGRLADGPAPNGP